MVNACELDKQITAYRFALYELGLFLDSHPCDQQALQLKNTYKCKLKNLIDEYEQHYGPYVLTQNDVGDNWKDWVGNPWPWDIGMGGNRCVAI